MSIFFLARLFWCGVAEAQKTPAVLQHPGLKLSSLTEISPFAAVLSPQQTRFIFYLFILTWALMKLPLKHAVKEQPLGTIGQIFYPDKCETRQTSDFFGGFDVYFVPFWSF